ncbi:MAG: urate hydroxylase PuuD [Bacteroidota bacterium]
MDYMDFLNVVFRWFHIIAGLFFVGLNWWFNLVFAPFASTTDGETRKKTLLELIPRALYWFKWSAIYTLIFGALLLILIFYMGGLTIESQQQWTAGSYIMAILVFLIYRVYVLLANSSLGKDIRAFGAIGFVIVAAMVYGMIHFGNFSYRGYVMHLGVMFGVIMIGNVFETMLPAQKKILAAIASGTSPDPLLVARIAQRGQHNMYLSVPLLWTMIEAHTAVPAADSWLYLLAVILIGWFVVSLVSKKAGSIQKW